MRFGIILWSFICAFCLIHTVMFLIEGRADTAIGFCTGFMIALYLFIAKTVQYIKEDYPAQLRVKINTKEKDE